MNPAYLTWMNPEMKGNLMYPQHSELMKNYYFDNKLGFDSMRDYDEMGQIHPPINISNINFIKNNQKKDNYSRKKRRRKSSSDSSSSSSDSSSTSRKKDSTNKAKKKTENRNENKKEDKYKRRNSVNKESSNKGNIKNYDEKIREKETTSSRLKTNNLNIKEYSNEEGKYNNKNVKPNPETNNFNLETVPNQNKIIGKFVDNVESGENTDDLLKNSPILSSKVPEKSLAKKERKTKFSSENPNSKQQCFEIKDKNGKLDDEDETNKIKTTKNIWIVAVDSLFSYFKPVVNYVNFNNVNDERFGLRPISELILRVNHFNFF